MRSWTVLIVLALLHAGCHSDLTTYALECVRFDDIAPSYLTLTQSWTGLGLDDRDRVYILFTSTRADGREDCALFRYTRATGKREFLGTFIDVAAAQGNLLQAEQIPKGHTHIVQVGRKLYMGSQGFHDFKAELDALPDYRGAHLFSYDLDSGAFDDASRSLPNGVLVEHQGIVAIAYSPEFKLLVGLTHPLGDMVLFDPAQGRVRSLVHGIPWRRNHEVSREIIVTRTGKVFSYRGPEEPEYRDLPDEVWVYDLASGQLKPTGQYLTGGFWNGQAEATDRNTIYVSTVSGELYALDVQRERFSRLGTFIAAGDRAEHLGVHYLYGISLSAAEDAIVAVPLLSPASDEHTFVPRLTQYNLRSGEFTAQPLAFESDVLTGSHNRDRRGNIYLSAFDWNVNAALVVLTPSFSRAYK